MTIDKLSNVSCFERFLAGRTLPLATRALGIFGSGVGCGLVALLLASEARATDITLTPQVTGKKIGTGYLPKLASDGQNTAAVIAETGKGLSQLESLIGPFNTISLTGGVSWPGSFSDLYSPPTVPQIGHAPSIAVAFQQAYPNYDNAIEVHQGGQESESSLWYQLGTTGDALFATSINWSAANNYDTGYDPTVAVDNNTAPSATTTTVVEVHQAGVGVSGLWYHVGTLTLGASPSMSSWSGALEINPGGVQTQGYVPTVSVANNLAILVAQGTGGALWYSIGVVDTATLTINWSAPIPYGTTGYNPTVSVYGDGGDSTAPGGARVVVEAHQTSNTTGPLTYRTGYLPKGPHGSAPTSITWAPDADSPLAPAGCYPSIALASDGYTTSYLSLTETHETGCGKATTIEYSFSTIND